MSVVFEKRCYVLYQERVGKGEMGIMVVLQWIYLHVEVRTRFMALVTPQTRSWQKLKGKEVCQIHQF